MPQRVAVVGNAPDLGDQGDAIDAADWVFRFNNAAGFGGVSGRRVTHLTLVNHGGQMREWLRDPGFIHRPAVRAAKAILFPFPPKAEPDADPDDDGRDWTEAARTMLAPLDIPVTVLSEPVRSKAAALLGFEPGDEGAPSTGFLVVLHLLETLPEGVPVDIHGFGFEGWPGHRWERERGFMENQARKGRLRLHLVGGATRR